MVVSVSPSCVSVAASISNSFVDSELNREHARVEINVIRSQEFMIDHLFYSIFSVVWNDMDVGRCFCL